MLTLTLFSEDIMTVFTDNQRKNTPVSIYRQNIWNETLESGFSVQTLTSYLTSKRNIIEFYFFDSRHLCKRITVE